MKRAEMFEQAETDGRRRDEDYNILHGVLATAERIRSYWTKALEDPGYRHRFGRRDLPWCEQRWAKCKAQALDKIRLVKGRR